MKKKRGESKREGKEEEDSRYEISLYIQTRFTTGCIDTMYRYPRAAQWQG